MASIPGIVTTGIRARDWALFPVSPVVYGGGISGACYSTHSSHPNGSPRYPPPPRFPSQSNYPPPPSQFPFQPSYPPPPLPSQIIINGHFLPPQFPCVPPTRSQFFPPPYLQPIHPIAPQPPTTTPQSPSIPTYYSPHPTPNIGIHPSIPTFQSPSVPSFVPQLQFTDPKPLSLHSKPFRALKCRIAIGAKGRVVKKTRNPDLLRGVGKRSRSKRYHNRGLWTIKTKNGDVFPRHNAKAAVEIMEELHQLLVGPKTLIGTSESPAVQFGTLPSSGNTSSSSVPAEAPDHFTPTQAPIASPKVAQTVFDEMTESATKQTATLALGTGNSVSNPPWVNNTGLNLSHHEVGTEPLASAISTISTATLVCSDKNEVVSGANTSCVTSSETMVKLSRCTAPPLCNLALDIATVLRLIVTEEDHLLLDMISLVGQGEADDKPSLSLFERIINALSMSCKSGTLPVDSFTFVFPIMEQTLLSSEKTELHDNVLQIIYMHMNPILPLPRLQVISVPYHVLGIVQAYQYCIGSALNALCFGLQPDVVAPILYRVYAKVVHIRMASLTAVKCIPTVAIGFLIQKVEAATGIWIALHDPEKSVTKAVEDFWDCYGNDFGTDYLGLFKACSHVHYTVRYAAAEVLAAALDKSPDSIQESLSTLLLMYVCDASLSENNVNTGWLKVDSEMVMCSADAQFDVKLWPWLILCLQLYHWETKKSILVYREAFNQRGEMSQTTLSQNGPTLADKDNLIGIVAIIDWFWCALPEFGTVATLNAWLNDNFLCLPLENKPEKMTLFLADKLEKMGHKWLLTKSAAVMFVSKDGKYVALGSKDVDTFVVVIKKMEHEFIELRNHFLSQGVVNLLEEVSELAFAKFGPSVILLTGLQGIGKTTVFTTLKMAFLLCQVALTRMGKLQDERFLFSSGFSYDNYACFDIVMAKQLPNAACHSILFRLILGALRQESSEALRRWQYALLLSYFQYCQHMLDLDIPSTVLQFLLSTVLQFLLLDEQEVEDLDLQKISREQAEVAHGNFFILRKKATELCKGMDKLLQAFGIYIAFAYLAYHLCSVGPQLLIEQFFDVAFVGNFYDTNVDKWLPAHDERFICEGTKRISRRLLTLLQNPFANVRMGMMTPSYTCNDKLGVHEATKMNQLADKDNVSFHQWGITFVIFYFEFVYHLFMSQCCWYNIFVKMLHMLPDFDSEYET